MKKEYVVKLGANAATQGKPSTLNPYAHGTTYWTWWNEGWEAVHAKETL